MACNVLTAHQYTHKSIHKYVMSVGHDIVFSLLDTASHDNLICQNVALPENLPAIIIL